MSKDIEKNEPAINRARVAEGTCLSDNGLFAYEQYLNFPTEKYFGGKVLDIGAGYGERFNIEAASEGVEVISLNPELKREGAREMREEIMESKHADLAESIAGLAQELPFKNGTFDGVTSLCGVPRYLERSLAEYRQAFSEIMRVLKPGGQAYIYPIDHEKVEGEDVIELVEGIDQVSEVEIFEKDHHGVGKKKGMIITKKS